MSKVTVADCTALRGLFGLCMKISNNTKADCFFNYSPHTNTYMVYVYRDGWSRSDDPEYIAMCYDITGDNIAETCSKLNALYKELMKEAAQ